MQNLFYFLIHANTEKDETPTAKVKCKPKKKKYKPRNTALLKITVDISMKMDRRFIAIPPLLDVSKAFDTVNFKRLYHKFKIIFGFLEFRYSEPDNLICFNR
jgi:hypothetical protein